MPPQKANRVPGVFRRLLLVAMLPCVAPAGAESVDSAVATIIGTWSGDARLFDKSLRARTGALPVRITIDPELGLAGRIGDAHMPRTLPRATSAARVEYAIRLGAEVKAGIRRQHLIVIVSPGNAATLDADFHLKSRFGFDPGMHVGHFDVKPVR